MQKLYFVRHGQGQHNVQRLYSNREFELTQEGRNQAKQLAQRFTTIPIDLILVSPFVRTKQTAEIINQVLDKPVTFTELLAEVKRPSDIAGKFIENPEVMKIKSQMDENYTDPNWHFSDEENFFDLKNRAQKFINSLDEIKEENILAVSHMVFIKMITLFIVLGESLTPANFLDSYHTLKLETSGLTLFQKENSMWKLVTWNDHSHLG